MVFKTGERVRLQKWVQTPPFVSKTGTVVNVDAGGKYEVSLGSGWVGKGLEESDLISLSHDAPKRIQHSETADVAIADLMNVLDDGSVDVRSNAHLELSNAINTYLLERGFTAGQLADLWTGEIQLTSS